MITFPQFRDCHEIAAPMVCELLTRYSQSMLAVVSRDCNLNATARSAVTDKKQVLASASERFLPSGFAWHEGQLLATLVPERRQGDYTSVIVRARELEANFLFTGHLHEEIRLAPVADVAAAGNAKMVRIQNQRFSHVVEGALNLTAPKSGGKTWEQVFRIAVERERLKRAQAGMGNNQLFGTW